MRIPLPRDPDPDLLLSSWRAARRVPGGAALFSKLVARQAPYSATIDARILDLERGFARLSLRDRPRLRNHIDSIHAIAMANLAEETIGLGMLSALPRAVRGIVTSLHMDYRKKARGTLVAECRAPYIEGAVGRSYDVVADVTDTAGDLVARCTVGWLVRPK